MIDNSLKTEKREMTFSLTQSNILYLLFILGSVYICSPARVHRNSGSETEAWPAANQRQDRPIWGWGDCQSVSRWHNSSAGLYTSLCDTRDEVIKYDNIYSRFQSGKSYPRNTEQQATLIWWTWWIRKYIKLLLYFVKKQLVQQSVKFCL